MKRKPPAELKGEEKLETVVSHEQAVEHFKALLECAERVRRRRAKEKSNGGTGNKTASRD